MASSIPATTPASLGFRKLQTGLVRNYALGIVLGTAALLAYLLIWAAR